jgi:hypothetical protein
MELGIEVLNGTTSSKHMREDFEGIEKVHKWTISHSHEWDDIRFMFSRLTDPGEVPLSC